MLYVSLGSQPSVSNALKELNLNANETLLSNVGNFSYESLIKNLEPK